MKTRETHNKFCPTSPDLVCMFCLQLCCDTVLENFDLACRQCWVASARCSQQKPSEHLQGSHQQHCTLRFIHRIDSCLIMTVQHVRDSTIFRHIAVSINIVTVHNYTTSRTFESFNKCSVHINLVLLCNKPWLLQRLKRYWRVQPVDNFSLQEEGKTLC